MSLQREIDVTANGENKRTTYYAVCPMCGYKLLKGAEGTLVEMLCPKCYEEVIVTITKELVQTAKGKRNKK